MLAFAITPTRIPPVRITPVHACFYACLMAGSMALSACAGPTAYDNTLSPAQNQLRQSSARFSQTVGEGAVAGALLGGIAGLVLGGRNRAGAAAIGAAAGGALGAGAGYAVARNNLSRSSTEAQYADAIQQAQADAQNYRSAAADSRQVADQAYAEAGQLRSQARAGQITQAEYRSKISRYQADQDAITAQIKHSRETSDQLVRDASVASGSNRGELLRAKSEVDQSRLQFEQSQARMSQAMTWSA